MRFAYADPPYPDCAGLYPEKREVDHADLVGRLCRDYPDGWALSTASTTLQEVLAMCPPGVRVAAWVKPFASFKPGVNPAYAWEPVIFMGGRPRGRERLTVTDWISASITLRRGLVGAKPAAFCYWLFALLGMEPTDEFHDLYPGSGAVSRAWDVWRSQIELPLGVT